MRWVAIVLCASLASVALCQTRAAIQAQYDRFAKAYVVNDAKAMLSILAPEYRLINESQNVTTRAAYAKRLWERQKSGVKNKAYTVEIQSLKVRGHRATVLTHEVTEGPDGERRVHKYRDVWRRTGGVWKLASTTTLSHGEQDGGATGSSVMTILVYTA